MTPGLVSRAQAEWKEFTEGYTSLVTEGEAGPDFGIHVLRGAFSEAFEKEAAWVLLDGKARLEWESPGGPSGAEVVSRASLFDEEPTVFHAARGTRMRITPLGSRVEWAVARAANAASFEPRLF